MADPAGPPEPPRRPPALADLRSVRTWAELRSQGKPGASAFDEAGIAADVLVVLEANDVMAEWCSVAEAEVAALRARLDAAAAEVERLLALPRLADDLLSEGYEAGRRDAATAVEKVLAAAALGGPTSPPEGEGDPSSDPSPHPTLGSDAPLASPPEEGQGSDG